MADDITCSGGITLPPRGISAPQRVQWLGDGPTSLPATESMLDAYETATGTLPACHACGHQVALLWFLNGYPTVWSCGDPEHSPEVTHG